MVIKLISISPIPFYRTSFRPSIKQSNHTNEEIMLLVLHALVISYEKTGFSAKLVRRILLKKNGYSAIM